LSEEGQNPKLIISSQDINKVKDLDELIELVEGKIGGIGGGE